MDPVSFAASLVTLLGLAGAASKSVYSFILDIHDVPVELRSQATKLQSLHGVLSVLVAFYEIPRTDTQAQLDPFLEDQLRRFLNEIQGLEAKLNELNLKLNGSGRRHLRERLRWLCTDRELRKFLASLDSWMQIFCMAVATTNMKLSSRIVEQATPAYLLLSTMHTQQQQLISFFNSDNQSTIVHKGCQKSSTTSILIPDQESAISPAFRAYLNQGREYAGLKVRYWYTYAGKVLWVDIRAGRPVLRSWSDKGRAVYRTVPWKDGACLVLAIQPRWLLSKRITLTMSYILEVPKMNLHCSLATCGILQESHPARVACVKGDWLALRKMIQDKQASISDATERGSSLLHIAAEKGHLEVVNGLLQEGARVNAESDLGETPLHKAIWNDRGYDIASRLLTYGADLSHQDIFGRTALHTFINTTAKAVLEFHQEDLDKCTHDAVGRTISHAVSWSEGSLPVDLCRTHNEDTTPLEQTDNLGRTVLHYASRRSNVEIVESLLQHKKARLARPDNEGRTPMHLASESERSAQTIDTLVRSGLDSHAVDHQGRTVLHIAASAGNVPAVEKLLEHGADADMHVVDENGHTPFQLAATLRRAAVVDVLRSRGWGAQSLELPEDEEEAEVSMVSYTGAVGKQSLDILCAVHKALEVVGLCALVWIGLRFWNIA